MTTIEKIKAGHPCEEVKFPVYEYYGCEKTVSGVRLFPEPSPGEVLTEEWARYYINIGKELEWSFYPCGKFRQLENKEGYVSGNSYRLPLTTPKLRNIAPEELPPFWGMVEEDGVDVTAMTNTYVRPDTISDWCRHKREWTSNGKDRNSFQVPVSPDNGE